MVPHVAPLTCDDCIQLAGEYIDQVLSTADSARLRAHVEQCAACARYLRVLSRGLSEVQALSPVEPTPGFEFRLHARMRAVDEEVSQHRRAAQSGTALALALAGMVALVAWSPLFSHPANSRTSTVTALAAEPEQQVSNRNSVVRTDDDWDWWYGPMSPGRAPLRPPTVSDPFPGPYSPLRIMPPLHNTGGRTVLTGIVRPN